MPSTATTRNRFEKQASGENSNTWGTKVNVVWDMIDACLDGVLDISGATTLTNVDYTADQAKNRVLNCTGTTYTITIPNANKVYLVRNAASGNVTISTATPTASAVIKPGNEQWVFCNGAASVFLCQVTDFSADNLVTTGTLASGALTVTGAAAASGAVTGSNLSGTNTGDQFTATTASRLLGRGSAAGAGAAQEITLGTALSMSGTTLNATGVTDGDKGDVVISASGATYVVESANADFTVTSTLFGLTQKASADKAGTNIAGDSLTVSSGKGTGTGAVSSVIFQTPTVGSTGTTPQTMATRLTVDSGGATLVGTLTATTVNHATGTNHQIGGATIAAITATGLAVTGVGSFSGDLTASGTNGLVLFSGDPTNYNVSKSSTNTLVKSAGAVLHVIAGVNTTTTSDTGFGYIVGVGGGVVQATSRTTGVTLNKVCGYVQLVSAAGTTAWQSFTVTNSKVAEADTIIVSQRSGTDLNMLHVTNVTAGSFKITFATTGGTTTEQPVFNFAIFKAAQT